MSWYLYRKNEWRLGKECGGHRPTRESKQRMAGLGGERREASRTRPRRATDIAGGGAWARHPGAIIPQKTDLGVSSTAVTSGMRQHRCGLEGGARSLPRGRLGAVSSAGVFKQLCRAPAISVRISPGRPPPAPLRPPFPVTQPTPVSALQRLMGAAQTGASPAPHVPGAEPRNDVHGGPGLHLG